ncbi:MAG: lipase family protein [Cyanobacteria bacterium P01_A01_bin.123]
MVDYQVALRCARLSQEVYQEFTDIQFSSLSKAKVTLFESEANSGVDTQVALLHDTAQELLYIVFRGSDKDIDWITNLRMRQKVYPYGDENSTDVRFHLGFMDAYFAVREPLLDYIRKIPQYKLIFTGHSLGGALATIAILDTQYNITQHNEQLIESYTFGSPRVGNDALIASFHKRVPLNYRFVYGRDIVAHVPRVWQGYRHAEVYYSLGPWFSWKIISRRLNDHRINNYINALAEKV